MIRLLDLLFSTVGLVLLSPVLIVVLWMGWMDTRSPLFRQQRVGRYQKPFVLVKFRTMRPDTASVASHLADASAITPLGRFLRRTKLDELPQLWNVLKGEMSLVGPRPCLFNQQTLIDERERRAVVHDLHLRGGAALALEAPLSEGSLRVRVQEGGACRIEGGQSKRGKRDEGETMRPRRQVGTY